MAEKYNDQFDLIFIFLVYPIFFLTSRGDLGRDEAKHNATRC